MIKEEITIKEKTFKINPKVWENKNDFYHYMSVFILDPLMSKEKFNNIFGDTCERKWISLCAFFGKERAKNKY